MLYHVANYIARAPSTRAVGKKLLQDLHNLESTATKKAMVRFRGAREKGAMIFVECLGFSQEDTMVDPL